MTATLATPTREALAALVTEAAEHRESRLEGCCWADQPCGDHQPAVAMGWALRMTALAVRACISDGEALEVIRSVAPRVLDEIRGATTDGELIAAIGGTGEEK